MVMIMKTEDITFEIRIKQRANLAVTEQHNRMMSCELIFTHLPAGPLSQQTPCDSEKQTQCKKIIKAAALGM